jgi:DNA-3-methyladenine glycosylase
MGIARRTRDWGRRLERAFFEQDAVRLARSLIGTLLVRRLPEGTAVCRIVETEAYMGPDDRASHAYGNRRSRRTPVFYGPGGVLYIYLIYGMYHCCNIIANREGIPEAVLLRAAQPVAGGQFLRGAVGSAREARRTSGPGRLCRALVIDMGFYGYDLTAGKTLFLAEAPGSAGEKPPEVGAAPRVNIDYAGEYRERPWRFYEKGNPFVSHPLPSPFP